MLQKNPDFRLNRMRNSRKNELFEVHIERPVITHLITVLFVIFRTFFSHMPHATCVHAAFKEPLVFHFELPI